MGRPGTKPEPVGGPVAAMRPLPRCGLRTAGLLAATLLALALGAPMTAAAGTELISALGALAIGGIALWWGIRKRPGVDAADPRLRG